MDTTDSQIVFDENGVCDWCNDYYNNILPGWEKIKEDKETLMRVAEQIKKEGQGKKYDCIIGMSGGVETAEMSYIVRYHCRTKFEQKKTYLQDVADFLNKKYGEGVVTLNLRDQYYNMREQVELYPEVVDKAIEAMKLADVEPIIKPIRGGTDGARLSFMNLPCPNLFTGMMNFHGKYEYCSVDTMEKAVETILNLVKLWAK
jgi:tripeptide aminopeptidase